MVVPQRGFSGHCRLLSVCQSVICHSVCPLSAVCCQSVCLSVCQSAGEDELVANSCETGRKISYPDVTAEVRLHPSSQWPVSGFGEMGCGGCVNLNWRKFGGLQSEISP